MVKRKPATEVSCLPNQEYLLRYFSSVLYGTFCIQNNKFYHLLDAVIPYCSAVSLTLDSQTFCCTCQNSTIPTGEYLILCQSMKENAWA